MKQHTRAMRVLGAGLLGAGLTIVAAPAAKAADTPWLVRTTALLIKTDVSSHALDLDVKDMADLAVDVSYFFVPNISVDVLATVLNPEVTSKTLGGSIGSVGLVPPIVTAQYHFTPGPTDFYAGGGFNYNMFHDESGQLDALDANVKNSVGWVVEGGLDAELTQNAVISVSLKYLSFKSDVDVDGHKADKLKVNAFILGIGMGFRL